MTVSIRPAAATAFNDRAEKLIATVTKVPSSPQHSSPFPSEVPIAASVSEKDMIGEMEESLTDYKGSVIGRYFYINSQRYALDGERYSAVKALAATIVRHDGIHRHLSTEYVEALLFTWVKSRIQHPSTDEPFCSTLAATAAKDIVRKAWWIPIANLEVEAEFPVGDILIRPVSKSVMDAWSQQLAGIPEEHRAEAQQAFAKLRQKFQGRAAAYLILETEPARGFELSIEKTEVALSVIALYSKGAFLPDVKCLAKPSGCELLAQVTVLSEKLELPGLITTRAILDSASASPWRLSLKKIAEMRTYGLDLISGLLRNPNPSPFERTVLNGLLIYSKAAYSNEPIEKIIYILSFLESMLLKNENESIQQNLAERMAVMLSKELPERKSIIANMRAVYGVRSRYLHHGNQKSELDAVTEFMKHTWVFFTQVLGQLKKFEKQADFVSFIDDAKLS